MTSRPLISLPSSSTTPWGKRIAGLLGCGVLAMCVGCASVAPYQRETLSRPDMAMDANGELQFGEEHARSYREGSSGAGRARGGGCGCN